MHKFCLRPPDPAKYWQVLEHVRCNTFASNAYPSSPRSAACLHLGIGSVPLEMIVFQECSPGRRTVTQPSTLTAQGAELHFESSRLGAASWREKHSCIMLWAKEDYEIKSSPSHPFKPWVPTACTTSPKDPSSWSDTTAGCQS
ncbi:hypothetical protein NUW54_g6771 [Trametes sanguinea]|uniref:Uncharacterized protein n=1 Tax=Trametes sanguinea TaxID=158606 RepID=A0ACC1PSB5_9APHY|nr:hypothetical protein NUW54_g6771 [Trametes sanguinea]